jgi:hypothetical protein
VADGDGGTTLQCRCRRGNVRAASIGDNGGGWGSHRETAEAVALGRESERRRGLRWWELARQTHGRW